VGEPAARQIPVWTGALAALAGAALLIACWAPSAHAYRLAGKRWPGKPATITYWNGTGYDEEVAVAVQAWNTSGVRVRFVRAKRARADVAMTSYPVLPGVLQGYGAAGRASVGYSPFSYVRVSRGSEGAAITGVIAHELGHVLGLEHENRFCSVMNTLPWVECDSPRNCAILQPDDLRGAIRRYGGRARRAGGELCPPPPIATSMSTIPNSYRAQLSFDLPQALGVGGFALRIGVGSCPSPTAEPTLTQPGLAGQSVLADVTPDDPQASGRPLCVRLWSSGEDGRLGPRSTTVTIEYRPDPLPAPGNLTASGTSGGAIVSWAAGVHRALVAYETAYQAGEACPGHPADVAEGQRGVFTAALVTSVSLTAAPGRYCMAVWSRDYFGKLSAASSTVLVDVPAR